MIERNKTDRHKNWLPRVSHLTDTTDTIGDDMSHLYVSDSHQMPYVGDFPPKDTYKEGIYD